MRENKRKMRDVESLEKWEGMGLDRDGDREESGWEEDEGVGVF